jgi:hypothetical protein
MREGWRADGRVERISWIKANVMPVQGAKDPKESGQSESKRGASTTAATIAFEED